VKIMFCGYGGAHIRTQIPVIRKLRAETDLDIEVLALTTAAQVVEREGIPAIGYRHLLSDDDDRARRFGERLAAAFPPNPVVSQDETIAYLGLNYLDLVERHGEAETERLYEQHGRAVFAPFAAMEMALQDRGVDMAIASNAPRTERALIKAAQNLGKPNLVIGDAFLTGEMNWLSDNSNVRNISVFSNFVKRQLVGKGRDAGTVFVTGNPALDRLALPSVREQGMEMRADLGWQDNKVLTWALPLVKPGDTRVSPVEDTLDCITTMCRRDPSLRVLVRPHPNSQGMFGDLPDAFSLHPTDRPVDEAIFCCDALLTEFSMVGLEAAIAGKPVITIKSRSIVPYAELGVSVDVDSVADLPDTLNAALSGQIRPRTEEAGIPRVGEATGNVCSLILKILGAAR
jgi:hypothetical protein